LALEVLLHVIQDLPELSDPRTVLSLLNLYNTKTEELWNLTAIIIVPHRLCAPTSERHHVHEGRTWSSMFSFVLVRTCAISPAVASPE
jgi:hypothetical protein